MADYSAKDVAALRKETGAGMMDCKKALEESGGNLEEARDWLRKKGLAGATKRAGRSAEQGAIDVVVDGPVAALVEITCETDFVAKGDDFRSLVASLAAQVAKEGEDLAGQAYEGSTVGEYVTQAAARLGENVGIGRVVRYETADGLVDAYKHIQNERGVIGVLVELGGVDASDAAAVEVAHDVALHIASAAPRFVRKDEVPTEAIDREREVLTELTRNEGKPEAAIGKIVEGRLNSFYKDYCLEEQAFVKDPKTTVAALVAGLGAGATIRRFARVKIGEE